MGLSANRNRLFSVSDGVAIILAAAISATSHGLWRRLEDGDVLGDTQGVLSVAERPERAGQDGMRPRISQAKGHHQLSCLHIQM